MVSQVRRRCSRESPGLRRIRQHSKCQRPAENLAVNWNLGEETRLSPQQIQAMAGDVAAVDPHDHNMAVQVGDGASAELTLPKGRFGYGWFKPRTVEGLNARGQVEGGGQKSFTVPRRPRLDPACRPRGKKSPNCDTLTGLISGETFLPKSLYQG